MNIDYSRNMKRIDAKKLKCAMWDIISGNTECTVSIFYRFKSTIIIAAISSSKYMETFRSMDTLVYTLIRLIGSIAQ